MEMFLSGDSIQVKCTRLMNKGKERLEKDEESPKKTDVGLPGRQGALGKRRYEEVNQEWRESLETILTKC